MNFSLMRLFVWLPTALLCLCTAVGAQTAPPAPKPFEDSIAQRSLACTHCHGAQGRAAPDGYYPRLAGKPAGYLYNQLLHAALVLLLYQLRPQCLVNQLHLVALGLP